MSCEIFGALVVWIMAAAIEALKCHVMKTLGHRDAVLERNDRVAISPKHGNGRQIVELVCVIEEGLSLTAPADHAANGATERSCGARHCVHPRQVRDVVVREVPPEDWHRDAGARAHQRLHDRVDETWCGGCEPQQHEHLATETTRRDEAKTTDARAIVANEDLRDPSAERVAHEVGAFDLEVIEPGADHLRVPLDRIRRVRATREPMTWQIGHQHAVGSREDRSCETPASVRVGQPVQQDEWRPASELGPVQVGSVDVDERSVTADAHPCASRIV